MIQLRSYAVALVAASIVFLAADAQAHSVFKKYLSSKFPDKKMTCDVCHVKGQKKDVKNSYGQLFIKVMNKPDLTKDWKAKSGTEKKDYEKEVMVPAFAKAYDKISKMTFKDIINLNLADGVKGPVPEGSMPMEDDEAMEGKNDEKAMKEGKDSEKK